MKVSFDFDDTLDQKEVQNVAKALIKKGHGVHIVTSRMSDEQALSRNWNEDLWLVANSLGIVEENVHFTARYPKYEFFQKHSDFAFHIDDDYDEIVDIDRQTEVFGILYPVKNDWRKQINYAIELKEQL